MSEGIKPKSSNALLRFTTRTPEELYSSLRSFGNLKKRAHLTMYSIPNCTYFVYSTTGPIPELLQTQLQMAEVFNRPLRAELTLVPSQQGEPP